MVRERIPELFTSCFILTNRHQALETLAQTTHGSEVQDTVAVGPEQESLQAWRERCNIKTESQIRLVKLSHMRYQHPDLDEITMFLQGETSSPVLVSRNEVWC